MLKTFIQLLGDDAPVFRRYCAMAIAYGVLGGLTITALVLAGRLLSADVEGAALWLLVLLAGLLACWGWRRQVERAGVRVGVTVCKARQRLGDHVARLPVGWFTPENTASSVTSSRKA
jgi:ATP-binding cassette subfamily B protein